MKRVFVDTNVIVDLVADRQPYSKFAIEIFKRAEAKKLRLFTSSHSVATTHYLLKKFLEEKSLRELLLSLMDYLTVIPVSEDILKKGLRSKISDFEDSIQIYCATTIDKIDCIVTRNVKDFKNSEIAIMTPDEFLHRQ